MPKHVRLLVIPLTPVVNVSRLLADIKRPVSLKIKHRLIAIRSPLLTELTIRQRPGVSSLRFWQEGPGYDRNLSNSSTIQAAIDYIHENPVRRGLCRRAVDWKYSSACRLLNDDLNMKSQPVLYRIDVADGLILPSEYEEHC